MLILSDRQLAWKLMIGVIASMMFLAVTARRVERRGLLPDEVALLGDAFLVLPAWFEGLLAFDCAPGLQLLRESDAIKGERFGFVVNSLLLVVGLGSGVPISVVASACFVGGEDKQRQAATEDFLWRR